MTRVDKSGWQPIETAPRNATPIDVWRGEWKERATNVRRVRLAPDNIFYESVSSGPSCIRDATHWMPIPDAPKTERGSAEGAERP